ncbi:major paralogous domain-containing protein [Fibrobacter sp. UWH5]|uniref:FISUMP domain-containing protein n=1 Tax=Fibrobacter sp. UWH5 TaxID=1896211 RepID=UPI00091FA8BE|nr:FISUMP domain-containing protein [Fibrobacter sp. UWH5]SHK44399.1 major paralogous domain-containing protein [Fibrobacter sp. UWH5]
MNIKRIACVAIASALFSIGLTACGDDIRVEKYPSGKVRTETTYVNDKKQGPEREFYENGNLKREVSYVNDRKQGISKEYYDDGSLQAEYNYEDGYIDGMVVRYHKNGNVSSKAEYKQNKQVAFGEYFNEKGEPLTSGSYKDPRDGYAYEWIRIGSQLWVAENMNYATASGSVCAQCNHWGRLYNFENAKKACLDGFHLPTKEEWNILLTYAGTGSKVGTALKAGYGWDTLKGTGIYGNGKDELGFGAKAGGGHFAKSDVPMKDRKFEGAGQKAYFWVSNGEVVVLFHDKDTAKFEKFNPEHGASLRCIKD